MIKKYNIKIHTLILLLISILFFIIYFLTKKYTPDSALVIYKIGMLIYGVIILAYLSIFENTLYGISFFMNVFLIDEMGFTNYDNMFLLINVFLLTILGLIINLFRFKPKIKPHHYTKSTIIFGLGIALAGLGVKEYNPDFLVEYYWFMPFLVGFLIIMAIILLNYFSASTKSNLEDLAYYFSNVVILIFYEILVSMITFDQGISQFYIGKNLHLGIGSPNTVAIILQMAMPFMLFFSFKNKSLYFSLIFYMNLLALFETISRGAILVTVPLITIYFIYLVYKNHHKKNIFNHSIGIMLFIIYILIFLSISPNLVTDFLNSLFNNRLSSLNGRLPIYNFIIEHYKENPLFGIGIVSNSLWNIEGGKYFLFAHSTFLEMLWMGGVILVLCFSVHLVDKYYHVYDDKKYGLLLIVFFIIPGIYGLFDVTYFNIHYTLYLLIVMYFYKKDNNYDNSYNYYNLLYKTP